MIEDINLLSMPGSFVIRVFNTWCMSGSSHVFEYWCYHCDKRVTVENQLDVPSQIVCNECKSSLVESNSTAPPLNHLTDDVASDNDSLSSFSEEDDLYEDDEDESRWFMMLKLNTLDKLKNYENILSRLEADEDTGEKNEREDNNYERQYSNDIQSQIDARIDAIHGRIRYLKTCRAGQQFPLREIEDELEHLQENEYLYFSSDIFEDDESDNDEGGGRKGAPPASESAVAVLPNMLIKSEEEALLCAVCQDLVNVGETAKELCCGHRFHGNCIVSWLASRYTCPVCRFELPSDKCD